MAILSKFQDNQAIVLDGLSLTKPKTQQVANIFRAIKRPDLSAAEAAESVGETKTKARERTLERRTILFGLPAHDQVLHSSVRNIEGVKVAPVAEFNTYDILKQRYLVLTREALTKLKDRVKQQGAARKAQPAAAKEHAAPHPES
jgi:large subunit ribosomal protein L4